MKQTELLQYILEKAASIQKEYGNAQLCPSHIGAAVADLCKAQYTGFARSDTTFFPRFEEERLRYLCSKQVRVSAYFRIRLSIHAKAGVEEKAFDLAACQAVAKTRGAEFLSADVVFLCALTQLHEDYRAMARNVVTAEDVLAALRDADANIYDYVITQLEAVQEKLAGKAADAKAIRDWKPAAKFAEPEDLEKAFFAKIEKTTENNVLTLKIPKFFGATALKLSIHRAGDLYYIHDNGCALGYLKKQVKDRGKAMGIVKKVCSGCWLSKGRITDRFLRADQFLYYLRKLILVAYADLYYTRAECQLEGREPGYVFEERADTLDQAALLTLLRDAVHFAYDENTGLSYWLHMRYPIASVRSSFLLETLEKGKVRISDARKGRTEGEIFEAFYWDHEDLAPHRKWISKLADRFGAEFDGRDVYLTDKQENFSNAMVRFFSLAVLLSEFGSHIAVPKGR